MEEGGDPVLAGQWRRGLLGLLKWKVFPLLHLSPSAKKKGHPFFLGPKVLEEWVFVKAPSGQTWVSLAAHHTHAHKHNFPFCDRSVWYQAAPWMCPGKARLFLLCAGTQELRHLSQEQELSLGESAKTLASKSPVPSLLQCQHFNLICFRILKTA